MNKRVVITGIGIISPIGFSPEKFLTSLLTKQHGITLLDELDGFPCKLGARIRDFDNIYNYSDFENTFLSRTSKFSLEAARDAIKNASLEESIIDDVILGSSVPDFQTLERGIDKYKNNLEFKPGKFDSYDAARFLSFSPASTVSKYVKNRGEVFSISASCPSGLMAIGQAYDRVKNGKSKVILAGGADVAISRLILQAFEESSSITNKCDEIYPAKPFDRRRDGYVLGEGAALFIVEELNHVLERAGKPYAEIVAYKTGMEKSNIIEASGKTYYSVMAHVLKESGEKLSSINAHAPGDTSIDKIEAKSIFKLGLDVPVTSIKGSVGTSFAAASALQVASAALSIKHSVLIPTTGFSERDPTIKVCVPVEASSMKQRSVMINSRGYGGIVSSLILKEIDA